MPQLRKINGRYYAYFYDGDRKPKRKSVSLGTSVKTAAKKRLRRFEEDYADGKFDPWNQDARPGRLSVAEAKDEFLKTRSNLRPKTRKAYRVALNHWKVPPGYLMLDVTADDVRSYVCDRTHTINIEGIPEREAVTVATLRKRYRHLRTFFNWAVREGLIDKSPLERVQPPKAQKKVPEFLTADQLKCLLNTIDQDREAAKDRLGRIPEVRWLKDLIVMAVCTGMRRGELVDLRWRAVDLHSGFVAVQNSEDFDTKSGHERRIPLVGDAVNVVQRRKDNRSVEPRDRVLTKKDGRPINATYASKRFKHYVRLAELPSDIKFHSLRHTCASWLVMKGVPLAVVQNILGHSSSSVTERYAHLAPGVMQEAMQQTFGDKQGLSS